MIRDIVSAVVVPAVVGGLIMLGARLARRWHGGRRAEHVLFALAVAVGFVVAFVAVEGRLSWPPAARWHWLVVLAGAGVAVGTPASLKPTSVHVLAACAVLAGAAASWMIRMPDTDTLPWRGGLGLVVCGLAILLSRSAPMRGGAGLPLGLATVFAAMGPLFMAAHFAKMTLLAAACAALYAVAAAATRIGRVPSIGAAATIVAAALIPTFALTGYSYDYGAVRPLSWILVTAAPAAMALGAHLASARKQQWLRWMLPAACVLIPCTAAVAITFFCAARTPTYDVDAGFPPACYHCNARSPTGCKPLSRRSLGLHACVATRRCGWRHGDTEQSRFVTMGPETPFVSQSSGHLSRGFILSPRFPEQRRSSDPPAGRRNRWPRGATGSILAHMDLALSYHMPAGQVAA